MSSADYYKKQAKKNWNQRTYAWGQYFQMRDKNFELQQQIVERVEDIEELQQDLAEAQEENNQEPVEKVNNHLIKFIRELYEKAKIEITCPICLERIKKDNLSTTSCGHNFCEDCLKQAKEACNDKHLPCPVCRKKIFV